MATILKSFGAFAVLFGLPTGQHSEVIGGLIAIAIGGLVWAAGSIRDGLRTNANASINLLNRERVGYEDQWSA